MSALSPAVKRGIAKLDIARAGDRRIGCQHSGHQRRHRHHRLECRPWRINARDRFVRQWVACVRRELLPNRRESSVAKGAGSKLGLDTSARMSPVTASEKTLATLSSVLQRRVRKSCIAASRQLTTSLPDLPGTRASSRTTRPKALTSTWLVPAFPRSSASCDFSIPLLPMRKSGSSSSGSPLNSASETGAT